MASRNVFLTERGYGSQRSGNATVICGSEGQMLNLRLLTLPNKSIGGELVIVPLSERKDGSKSYINSQELVYEISLNRKGSGGTFRIREIDANSMSVKIMESGFIIQNSDGNVRFVDSDGMPSSETANELIQGKLWNAFSAAFKRSTLEKPNGLSYGKIAPDGEHQERSWFKKEQEKEKVPVIK
jgi:hypothetical protein